MTNNHLLHNLILFGRLLRALGMDVNPSRMIDLVQALEHVNLAHKPDFYYTARCLLVHNRDDLPLFDQAFALFWRAPREKILWEELFAFSSEPSEPQPIIAPPPLQEREPIANDEAEVDEEVQQVIEVTQTYSIRERLRHKDFGDLTQEELRTVRQFMAQMVWELGLRRTRRQRPGRGRRLDVRRSLRRNLRYGGELIEWPSRQSKFKPRPLIVMADISGSMERYARLLLHFIYSLAKGLEQEVEAFVFSTHLTCITRPLRGKAIDRALADVSREVTDWSGGTRIGDSLKTFNFEWGQRVLGRGAVVLLISDGWDRGDPLLLKQEIGRLQRSCHRLIWLNPLLGSAAYEPLTRGMQAALPHIDDFLPVHNLASLEDLAVHLQNLTVTKRPSRHQPHKLSGAAFSKNR
ncbi:MAG: VWA domain-containing protein [Ardenticatenaceae bacterium]|nr:VWA domain-containing protein [Anaerolineales bacterium]MCB8937740.1 VWA domain-containing protein [Ardenticatenaceae bacterium]MCB8974309.1 VWA domain-containing protein [Ardenticatenaceae bacterium]